MHKKIKTTITLSSHIKEFASKEAEALGLDFSAYITVLIAEKLRGVNIVSNNTPPPIITTSNPSTEVAITSSEMEIDDSQINELDRLLSFNEIIE